MEVAAAFSYAEMSNEYGQEDFPVKIKVLLFAIVLALSASSGWAQEDKAYTDTINKFKANPGVAPYFADRREGRPGHRRIDGQGQDLPPG